MIRSKFDRPIVRYLIAGGLSFAIELSFILLLRDAFGFSASGATAFAFWIGLSVSFVLQKILAFKDYQKNLSAIYKQTGRYITLVFINYFFTLFVVNIFPDRYLLFSRTFALLLTTLWNYYIYKKFIFIEHKVHSKKIKKTKLIDSVKNFVTSREFFIYIGLSLVVVIFFYQYAFTGSKKITGGDFDYYAQQYEAFRISVLKFKQFPLWNPWLAGGVPLFANPQFGLFSIQSIFVLLFGTVLGLKLAYIVYALLGFWGMYVVGRSIAKATKLRSALISYIWVFSGFFAGHNISHYTFPLFFLFPWLFYYLYERNRKYSWLWLGILTSVLILSSVHYAFLMISLALGVIFIVEISKIILDKKSFQFVVKLTKSDLIFVAKTIGVVLLLAGYRLFSTLIFVKNNERLTDFSEGPNSLSLLIKSMFLPIGTLIKTYPKTTWGWGEYSMYIGFSTSIAFAVCVFVIVRSFLKKGYIEQKDAISRQLLAVVVVLGLLGVALALGASSKLSPFMLLHNLPGFTQTRVPSRWLIFTVFSLLVFLAAWKRNAKLINVLLLISVIELFVSYGPPRVIGNDQYDLPNFQFRSSFSQYDNDKGHIGVEGDSNHNNSYLFATKQNMGQIYADDSLVNTLPKGITTRKCGLNKNPNCGFVLTGNAVITYWSPNKVILKRTNTDKIELNMNVDSGWRVNGKYIFQSQKQLNPNIQFTLPEIYDEYTLEYSPKYSPNWIIWKFTNL